MRPIMPAHGPRLPTTLIAAACLLWPVLAMARPLHVEQSAPAAEAIIHGDHAQYVVRFDGPVNHLASRMRIMQGDRVIETLQPLADSAADVLFASGAVPPPGHYTLHWEAVAADGELSQGDVPFTTQH
jgi:methionine-rich copper-binding protein CopC